MRSTTIGRLLVHLLVALPSLAVGQFQVIGSAPARNATNVSRQQVLSFTFSESVDPTSVDAGLSVTSMYRGNLEGTVSVQGAEVQFDPQEDFLWSDEITVTFYAGLLSSTAAPLSVPEAIRFAVEIKPPTTTPPAFKNTELPRTEDGIAEANDAIDFDGDGDIDLVGSRSWFRNDGDLKFTKLSVSPDLYSKSIRAADLDNDGDMDLAVGGVYFGLVVLINDGNQAFTRLNLTGTSINVVSIEIADIDSNGLPDIVCSRDFDTTSIFYQFPGLVFTPVVISPTRADKIKVIDFDKDGDWDVIQQDAPQVRYLENTGGGTFVSSVLFTGTVHDIAVADFEGDGDIDIISGVNEHLQIHENNGAGVLTPKPISTTKYPFGYGDLDGDGDIDLFFSGYYRMMMLLNDGSNNFTEYPMGQDMEGSGIDLRTMNPADADGDGDMDVFVGINYSSTILYKNADLHEVSFFSKVDGVKQLKFSASEWADYDNDDDVDLLICGLDGSTPTTILYNNQGGVLSQTPAPFTGVSMGSVDWGDFDRDGDLDVLLIGSSTAGPVTQVYVNTGGTFALLPTNLPGASDGRAMWGDFDNDHWLDIAIMGSGTSGLYRSNGKGQFELRYDLMDLYSEATMDIGDYDRDGDLDLAFAGWVGSLVLKIERNEGDWTFVNPPGSLTGVRGGSLRWTDVDSDGDLDLAAGGTRYLGINLPSFAVYQNNNGVFTQNPDQPSWGIDAEGAMATGDLDNDGYPDALGSTEIDTGDKLLFFMRNNQTGVLASESSQLPAILTRTIAFADFDGDMDLDAYAGSLMRSNAPFPNAAPQAPSGIIVDSVFNNSVYVHWNPAIDDSTPTDALTYDMYFGNSPMSPSLLRPAANLSTGKRKTVRQGAIGTPHKRVDGLTTGGTYYLGVQAVDAAFEGSAFSASTEVKVIFIAGVNGGCPGLQQSYAAKPPGAYTWQTPGGEILSGQNTDSIVVRWNTLGVGYVEVSDAEGNQNTLKVFIENKPQPQLNGPSQVCTGEETYFISDPLTMHASWSITGGHSARNATEVSGTIPWLKPGNHTIIVGAKPLHKGCTTYDTLQVLVDQRPFADILGPDEVCTEWVVRYETNSINPDWSVVGGEIVVDSTSYIRVKWNKFPIPAKVGITEVSARGYCTTSNEDSVAIYQSPGKPLIKNLGDTLYSTLSPSDYYEWYYENELVVYGPYVGIITNIPGAYRVVVYHPSGCGAVSDPFFHLVTGLETSTNGGNGATLKLFPNPTDALLNIELENGPPGEYAVRILSSGSQVFYERSIQSTEPGFQHTVDVSGMRPGMHIVTVSHGPIVHAMKFIRP